MEYICKPSKLSIYVNTAKKTAAQIKSETGCTALVNGGLYDMSTFEPLCHLKVLGDVLAKDQYAYFGLGWDDDIADSNGVVLVDMVANYVSYQNYICCVEMVRCGQPTIPMIYPDEMGGSRPRTAIGVFEDGRVWLYADKNNMTPEELRSFAVTKGVKHAIMLDGGGSTQGISPNGTVSSSRKVHNYICVWEKETGSTLPILEPNYKWAYNPGKRSTAKYLILHHAAGNGSAEAVHNYHLGKGWAGIAYHYYVRKDGTIYRGRPEDWKGGHTTGYSNDIGICFEGDFQIEAFPAAQATAGKWLIEDILSRYPTLRVVGHKQLGNTSCPGKYFNIDGYYPATDILEKPANDKGGKTVTITLPQLQQGDKNESVRSLQQLLNAKGYDCGDADGIFGTKTDKAFRAFQKDAFTDKKEWDGICGVKGWTALLT